ncbi:Intradiol ring-cleavage dioxygenase [Xylariaceae sp. FL1019]|nr:Intradiol ring-cleavage dioxygenase [Xylariaceae sp. FL1019]
MVQLLKSLAVALALPVALAHPGEDKEMMKREMVARNLQHAKASRALSACQGSPRAKALKSRAAARRAAKAHELRVKRGLIKEQMSHRKRDLTNLEYYTTIDHNRTDTVQVGCGAPLEQTIFGSNNTCALVPETTIGPYYVTGEALRQDITEGQAGVPMHIDLQFVDMNTCEPVPDIIADVWHCNSTGVYSGVDAEGEGGLDSTFLRGIQISDKDGVSAFDSLFPGHYDARITHFHLVAQKNYTLLPNDTYVGGTTLHVGQIYFDDSLIDAVEATYPYSTNDIAFTSWEIDGWMLEEATDDYDPFVEYVQLGDDLSDGLLTWITIAVDLSSDHSSNRTAAAYYYEDGGVPSNNTGKGLPPSNPNAPTPGGS